MFNERSVYKKKMLKAQSSYEIEPSEQLEEEISMYKIYQHALKICLNSAFGSLGNAYFRFYDIRNAEAITYSGQVVIKWIEKKLNVYLNQVAGTKNVDMILAVDTDSTFLHFNPIVEKIFKDKRPEEEEVVNFLTKVCDGVLQKFIDKSFGELCTITNAYENCLHMKREKICSSALWRKKKNYSLNVWDNEGVRYSEPKIKMSGIEAVKTSTPAFCRVAIKDAIDIIMNGEENELIDFITKTKSAFFALSPEEISTPRGITDMDKFYSASTIYRKSTPMHSRGALLYNYHLKRLKLTHKYSLISNGEKIKVCYLKLPNTIRENVIAYSRNLPPELGLHKYIDYETQFDKTFMNPITSLLDIIGWRTEKRVNLANFYV
jgi:DNA polymerase elongation subunit (family B)